MSTESSQTQRVPANERIFVPIGIVSRVYFRIEFGLLMFLKTFEYVATHGPRFHYVTPTHFFSYPGFSWFQPWPRIGMYLDFSVLMLLALAVALGYYYRLAMSLFGLGLTYVFLVEQ